MLKASLRFAWRSLNHLTRVALVSGLLLSFVAAAALLTLRYWILPGIERYHDQITAMASAAIGQPISIGKIEADWHGFRPHMRLTDVRILDKEGKAALVLQQVEDEVAWNSLLTGQVRLNSLKLQQPDLVIKRDAQGQLFIAGVPLVGKSSDNSLADWLLDPSRIVVRDARITWVDEQRGSPPLVLDAVNLLIENGWRRHRFALRALPPPRLSAELDLRGDFYGSTFNDLSGWEGRLYTRLEYADVAAWRTWLTLPIPLRRGKGALRGWLGFNNGKASWMTADLALSGVRTRLAEDLPPLDVNSLSGRIGWRDVPGGIEVSTDRLSLRLRDGFILPPTDFYLRLAEAQGKRPASGEVRANKLDFRSLISLSDFLPFDRNIKQKLVEFEPRGRVTGLHVKWQNGPDNKLRDYQVKGRFENLSLRRVGNIPGFSGLTGQIDGSDAGGTLSLNARKLTIDAPKIMKDPLQFDTLTAQANWHPDRRGVEFKFSNASLVNADMAGTLYGSYHTLSDGPGEADLTVHLTRASVHQVDRYIPIDAINREAHDWLTRALVDGQGDDFKLRLRGNLKDFPFPDNKGGVFQIRAHAKNGVLQYDPAWPPLDNIEANLLIEGNRLEVTSPSATTMGEHLQKVSVVLPDMSSENDMRLLISGEASGTIANGLDFIQHSPVRGYIGGFTDGMQASGNGMLGLRLDIPLTGSAPLKVSGNYRFQNNDVRLGEGVPVLRHTNGELLFSESGAHTQDLVAQVLGGPAKIDVHTVAGGTVSAKASGTTDFDVLRQTEPFPVLNYLHGGSPWTAQVDVRDRQHIAVRIDSNLVGTSSTLPAPLAKRSGDAVPLHFEQTGIAEQQDQLLLQYGDLLTAKLLRGMQGGERRITRGTVDFGNTGRTVNRDGVWLVGTIPHLSLQGWGAVDGVGGEHRGGLDIRGGRLTIERLSGYGQAASNVHIRARMRDNVLRARLSSEQLNGELSWQSQGQGKLSLHLDELMLSGIGKDEAAGQPIAEPVLGSGDSPEFGLVVDSLRYKGKQLGKFELQLQQHDHDWQLQHLALTNPDGVLTADGKWHLADGASQTAVNFNLQISDAGKILDRSGYPDSVKGGSGKLTGSFSWPGNPDQFAYAVLDGKLRMDASKGRFLKIDPGIGKLLGILSLQALPRHIALDFTDVFSEGFEFDSITGDALISNGVLNTSNFRIEGSSAKVTMAGQVDLNNETQNLRVRILPTVGDSVSLLGAFAAGPAIGIGTYIANKLLREPLDKLVSFEYNVTGSWADPSVTKVGSNKPAATNQQ